VGALRKFLRTNLQKTNPFLLYFIRAIKKHHFGDAFLVLVD